MEQTITPQNSFEENKEKFLKLSQVLWRDFGPLIIGALVLIVVLVGGWSLFKKSSSNTPTETVIDQTSSSDVVLPESTINLSGSPQPIGGNGSTPKPSPTPTPKVATETAATKGEQLPKTGPELTFVLLSLSAIAGGYLLFKKANRIL